MLIGTFEDNQMVRGKMYLNDGSYYEGEVKKDMMHGKGSVHLANGNVFVGTFQNDHKHGTGTLFDFENQTKQREEWVNGVRKNAIKTPTSEDELKQQLKNPGYIQQHSPTRLSAYRKMNSAARKAGAANALNQASPSKFNS